MTDDHAAHGPADPAPCFVCRCEELVEADIQRAMDEGARTVNDVKRRTRAAMGLCQGIYCVPTLAAMVAERYGTPLADVAPITARPPVRPIPLEALADLVPGED